MSQPENTLEDLASQFLSVARLKTTGTLRVNSTGAGTKLLYFEQGYLADADTGREETILEAALLDTGSFSEKEIRRARKGAAKSEKPLGAALLDLGLVPEDKAGESILRRMTEEVFQAFAQPLESFDFVAHKAEERLEGFFSELTDHFEVHTDPEEMFLEVARRLERWDLVEKNFSMLRDVFYATPASFHYYREQAAYPVEHSIITKVEGIRDVEEVIQQSGLDPFLAVKMIRKLQARGKIELINPVQMYQLGVDCAARNDFEKAAKLFRRALERGLDDFDLQLKLAQALDSLGRQEEAIERYMQFSEKCINQLRLDDAIRGFRRVARLNPDFLPAQEKCLEILLQQNRAKEAVDQAIALAEKKAYRGDPRAGLNLLMRVRALNVNEVKLHQKIIQLAEACEDHQTAHAEREALAKSCDQRKDVETALETYQRLFCEGDDSLEVRLKLVDLHRSKGNNQKALEHINSLLNLPEKRRVRDEATLLMLHQVVRAIKPSDLRSNRWLVDYHSKQNEKENAISVLTAWISSLEGEGDLEEVAHVYERLVSIDDRYEHRWGLAMVLEKLGRLTECRRELRSLANLALRKKEFDQAVKSVEYILKTAPFDLETRKMQVDLHDAREEADLALKKCEEIAILSIISGNVQEAELYARRLLAGRQDVAEIARKLGARCREQGDRQKGAEQMLKAASLHLERKNYGLCRVALDELLLAEPGHAEGSALLAELEEQLKPKMVQAPAAGAFGPSPQSAAAQGGTGAAQAPLEKEPFQPLPPVTTTVSRITARLKRLKSSGLSEGGEVKTTPAPEEAPKEGEKTSTASVSNAALKSAASKLKALAGKKAQETTGGFEEPIVPDEKVPPAAQAPPAHAPKAPRPGDSAALKKAKLDGPASKLAALRRKGEGSSADGPPQASDLAAPEDASSAKPDAPPAGQAPPSDGGAGGSTGSAPTSATQKLKLGTSASKLAALRKQSP